MTAKRFGVLLKQGNAPTGGTLAAGLCHWTESRCLAQWKWAHMGAQGAPESCLVLERSQQLRLGSAESQPPWSPA